MKFGIWKLFSGSGKAGLVLGFLALPFFVSAASFTVALSLPDENGLREGALIFSTDVAVNAIEGKVIVPFETKIIDITEAESVVEFWVEKPKWNEEDRSIFFSGIIPGGFLGKAALFHFYTQGAADGIIVDEKETRVFANDGLSTDEQVVALPKVLLTQDFALSGSVDTGSPEILGLQKAKLPGENNDQSFVFFHVRDTGSGVASSQVAFADVKQDVASADLQWKNAENPIALTKEEENKYIYLKAVDGAGNERILILPPDNANQGEHITIFFVILLGSAASLFLVVVLLRRNKNVPQRR